MKIHKMTVRRDSAIGVLALAIYEDHVETWSSYAYNTHEEMLDSKLAELFADAETVVSTNGIGIQIDFGGKITELTAEDDTDDDQTDEDDGGAK